MFEDPSPDFETWEGAIGPQSEGETWFYDLQVEDDVVQLIGPSEDLSLEIGREEFEALVAEGEWIKACNDWVNTVFTRID